MAALNDPISADLIERYAISMARGKPLSESAGWPADCPEPQKVDLRRLARDLLNGLYLTGL